MSSDTCSAWAEEHEPTSWIHTGILASHSECIKTRVIIYINGGTMYKCTAHVVVGSVCMQEVVGLREDE